ncbi:PQQ-binding-like beta-propeller repeat protein [Actinoplanes sp. NPDC051861]|uniref:WD40 repeat domain-containing protein n=1 Tax=Actinoplanes sp. NPDC051861 TaxID=3155170 RepID=UPI003436F774
MSGNHTAPPSGSRPRRRRGSHLLFAAALVASGGGLVACQDGGGDASCVASSGTVRTELDAAEVAGPQFSADGGHLLAEQDGKLVVIDAATGKVAGRISGTGRRDFEALSDGGTSVAAYGLDGGSALHRTGVWETASGKEAQTLVEQGGTEVAGLAVSPDGKQVATATGTGVHLWDVRTGRLTGDLKVDGGSGTVAFAPDGKLLAATGSGGKLLLWDTATGKAQGEVDSGRDSVTSIAVSPDGKYVAALEESGPVTAVEVATGRQVAVVPASGFVAGMAFGSDSSTIVTTSSDAKASRTGLADGKAVRTFEVCAPYRTSDLMVVPGGAALVGLEKTADGSGYELVTFAVP